VWEGEYGVILYTHVYEGKKMRPIETIPGMGEGG
jgi:hypothetical protein